jgi:hypothetical protein
MSAIEEIVAVRVAPAQAMRMLTTVARWPEWVSAGVALTPRTGGPVLLPGDRFRLEVLGTLSFEYTVEATTEREVVFSFRGPWAGEERWSFVADGAETIVRRHYAVDRGGTLATLAWDTVGRAAAVAQFKLELSRFRAAAERSPGTRAEIEARGEVRSVDVHDGTDAGVRPPPSAAHETPISEHKRPETPLSSAPPYPIDEG